MYARFRVQQLAGFVRSPKFCCLFGSKVGMHWDLSNIFGLRFLWVYFFYAIEFYTLLRRRCTIAGYSNLLIYIFQLTKRSTLPATIWQLWTAGGEKEGRRDTRGMYTGIFPTKLFSSRRSAPVNFQINCFGYGNNTGYGI